MSGQVHCSAEDSPSPAKIGSAKKRILQLNFRCGHFIATHEARFAESNQCYQFGLDQMPHFMWSLNRRCKIPLERNYRLDGDGHQFLLISQCLSVVREQKVGNGAYWLFVNKRNTPEQNGKIIRQLPLPKAIMNQWYEQNSNTSMSSDNLFKCDAAVRNCRWFCDPSISTANRTFDRAVRTEYFTSLVLQPLEQKIGGRHSIFAIGGIEPHCLELSIQCTAPRRAPNASLTAHAAYAKSSVLQIHIRCDHFIASYTAWYKDLDSCYDIFLDQIEHHMWNSKVTCKMPFSRNYRLEGDGHQYVTVVLCVNSISERKFGKPAYWLFVNKRNTPEQNRSIMQKLALPGGSVYQPYEQSANASGKQGMCRCDLFERYIRKVRSCKLPFDTTVTATRNEHQLIKPNETQTHAQQGGMLPLLNRSSGGALETDYLTSLRYKPLQDKYNKRHTIFVIPGVEPHCVELSVRCGMNSYRYFNASASPLKRIKYYQTVQLRFRCDHVVVQYVMYYVSPKDCYMVALDQMRHRSRGPLMRTCTVGETRHYRVLGDGRHYLLLLYCFKHVLGCMLGEYAYWLFVNKRNTVQQNFQIMQQLSLPNEVVHGSGETGAKLHCRCDIYERYIQEIKSCHRPFLLPTLEQESPKANSTVPEIAVKIRPPSSGKESEELCWLLIKCGLVSLTFGVISYVMHMQLKQRIEEQLSEGSDTGKPDTIKIKFIKVQESVESNSSGDTIHHSKVRSLMSSTVV
uniref:Uncharacterized protein n=1 Tax=Anopheles merus TaxID=30066 RepID=A0A182UX52_ANOME